MFKDNIKKLVGFLNRTDGSLKSKTLRSGFWVGISSLSLNGLSFCRNIILARLLMPEIFGLMGICLMVMRGVDLFTEPGFSAALIHRQDKFEEAKDTAFTLIVIRGLILAIIVFLIAPFVAQYYERQELDMLLKAIAVVFVFRGVRNINTVAQERNLDFKKLTYLNQITTILDFSLVITLAYIYRSVWALVLGQIFSAMIGTLFSYILIPGKPKIQFNKEMAKSLFGYGKYITGLTVVLFIASEIDNAVIGKILGMELLGYYVVAYMLANIPATHISKVVSRVMFPAYSKLQNDLPALQKAYLSILKLLSSITIPVAAGIGLLAPEILKAIYGERWLPATTALQILCVFGGCRSIIAINGYLYNAIGKPNISFFISSFRLFLIMMLIYPLTKAYNLPGASIAVTLPISLQLVLDIIIFTKILKLSSTAIVKILAPVVANTIAMSIVILVIKLNFSIDNITVLFLTIIVGIALYASLNIKYIFHLKAQIFNK